MARGEARGKIAVGEARLASRSSDLTKCVGARKKPPTGDALTLELVDFVWLLVFVLVRSKKLECLSYDNMAFALSNSLVQFLVVTRSLFPFCGKW